jgi:Zinc knuckle
VFYQPSANVDIEEKHLIGAGNTEMIRFQLTSLGIKVQSDLALKTHKRLLDNDQWPAASSIPKLQSDALPAAFQAFVSDPAASAAYQAMAAELNLLQMQAKIPTNRNGVVSPKAECMTNVTCYSCGQKGHRRVQCPNKPSWKFTAPVNGALTTITRKDKI